MICHFHFHSNGKLFVKVCRFETSPNISGSRSDRLNNNNRNTNAHNGSLANISSCLGKHTTRILVDQNSYSAYLLKQMFELVFR